MKVKWSNLTLKWAHLPMISDFKLAKTGSQTCNLHLASTGIFATSPHILEWHIVVKFQVASYYTFWDKNYFLGWILVKLQTDRWTDRKRCMSPPCISSKMQLDVDIEPPFRFAHIKYNTIQVMNFILVCCSFTDRQTDRQKVMHRSPPCNAQVGSKMN